MGGSGMGRGSSWITRVPSENNNVDLTRCLKINRKRQACETNVYDNCSVRSISNLQTTK